MKYLSIITCLILSFQLSAQNAVEKYFSNHLDNQEATVVQVNGKMFQYAAVLVPDETDELDEDMPVKNVKEMLANITSFVLVKVDKLENSKKEYRSGIKKLEASNYEELVRVTDKENNLSIFIDETNDVISEIVGVISTEDEFVVAALTGTIRLDQVQDIISNMQSEDMNSILKTADIEFEEMKVYPNPASANSDFVVQVPKKMMGGTITIYDMNGAKVSAHNANDKEVRLQTTSMTPGQYIVEIQNAGVSLKKKMILVQ